MSMAHGGERGASGRSRSRRAASSQTDGQEVWRPGSDDRDQDPLPDPTQTLSQELSGYLTPLPSEFSVFVSTGQDHWRRKWQSGSQQSPDDGCLSTPFKRLDKHFHRASGRSRSTSSLSLSEDKVERRSCRELLSLSSRGSYSVIRRWSGDGPDRPNQQRKRCLSRSDSLEEWMCPPLPGQVPVGPSETSNGRTAQGAMEEASPVNKSSAEKPTECRKRKGIGSFLQRLWEAMKSPFSCCFHSSAVDVVEPFVPPADLEPEPDPEPSPAPDHSAVKTNNKSFESLYNVGEMIGSGGFGSVYEGTRRFDGKKVAIKRMRKTDNNRYLDIPGHPKPLVTEVALLLLMRREPISPYIIQLYEWFEHPRKFTLVMEFPEPCESLLDFILRHPQLDETTARVIMRQAVLAVQHCIEHGVFHNDVHLQNFLLKKDTLQLKLIDFGCGQLFSSEGYERNVYRGVLDYCPPEVLTDPRFHAVPANVWSLGVLLYEMVNACSPFRDRAEITQAKVTFRNSSLSKECSDLISQCLTRDPTKRPTLEQMLQHKWIRKDVD